MISESQVSRMMRLLKAVDTAYKKVECPISHSELDDEQPIAIHVNLGDLRAIRYIVRSHDQPLD